jgi:hypothetical protein
VLTHSEETIGANGDDATVDRAEVADVLAGDVVGGLALLQVASLVDDEHEGPPTKGLAGQLQALLAQLVQAPGGVGDEVVKCLWVCTDAMADSWQRLRGRSLMSPRCNRQRCSKLRTSSNRSR